MPTITNQSEHDWHFNRSIMDPETKVPRLLPAVIIPRSGIRAVKNPVSGETSRQLTPGTLEVSEEDLAAMQKNPVSAGWFKPDKMGLPQCVVTPSPVKESRKAA